MNEPYIIYDQFGIGIVQTSHGRFITYWYWHFCDYAYEPFGIFWLEICMQKWLLAPGFASIRPYPDSPWTLHTTNVLLQLNIWNLLFWTVKLYTKISTNQAGIRTYLAPLGRFILTAHGRFIQPMCFCNYIYENSVSWQ